MPRTSAALGETVRDRLGGCVVIPRDQTHRIRLSFEADRVHLNVLTPDLGEVVRMLSRKADPSAILIEEMETLFRVCIEPAA